VLEVANQLITENSDKPKYRQLLNQSFELISFLLSSQPKIYVEQYVQPFITLLFAHNEKIDVDYFLSAWMRICRQYSAFVDISSVFPTLFDMVVHNLAQESDEWALMSLKCLHDTYLSFKGHMQPYLLSTIQLAKEGLSIKSTSNDNREKCVKLMTAALKCVSTDLPHSQEMENTVISQLQFLLNCIKFNF
jgi:hypothetical protein